MNATALIAEDEPLLAQALQAELARAWPELHILAVVGDGLAAVAQTLVLRPDVVFFDIQMPGQSGLAAAAELAEDWPEDERGAASSPFPALVFVTAYDQYAVAAFETQAMDYLLKPVQPARLAVCVKKVRLALIKRAAAAMNSGAKSVSPQPESMEQTLAQLRGLLQQHAAPRQPPKPLLRVIAAAQTPRAGEPSTTRLVPIEEVIYFEAADKYTRVTTATTELLIRTPLKELLAQLDAQQFWQIHRGTVVQVAAIDKVLKDDQGRCTLVLRGSPDRLAVSRLYQGLFKAM